MPTVYERVKAVVVDKLKVDEASVQVDTSFVENLNADSLDLVELIMAFEEEFSSKELAMVIPDEEARKITTVEEAVAWLEQHGVQDTVPTR